MTDFLIQAFITLLVIINPFAAVPVFVSLTKHDTYSIKKIIAKRSCIISIILLMVFAVIGDFLMHAMKISEAAFRITGGFLLLLSAVDMVRSNPKNEAQNDQSTRDSQKNNGHDICVFPLAIPFLAGPGALTSTVILMRQAKDIGPLSQIGLLGILIFMIAFTYICLIGSDRILKIVGLTGTNVLTRVFGIVLSALCVQNIINGVLAALA
jgi:multiple antibiotic resistance protein